jgi:pseudouridine-5'-phosphate glycosidase
MDSAAQIAASAMMRAKLGMKGGQLVANPIPPNDEIAYGEIGPIIEAALKDAATAGIAAKEVTPYLLDRIFALTQGRSLQSNIALVLNNARLAAQIAQAMQQKA